MSVGVTPNVAGGLALVVGTAGGAPGDRAADCGTVEPRSDPPTDVAPSPAPGPGSPYHHDVSVSFGHFPISGLPITCAETGVTVASACGTVRFYHDVAGTKHYSTPQAMGSPCVPPYDPVEWTAGSAAADVSQPSVSITVTKV